MNLRNTTLRYGAISQLFHWTIVVLIIVQFVLALLSEDAPLFRQLVLLARHKSFGMLILGLAILRLLWRWTNPTPPVPATMPAWQRIVAHVTHVALYALLILQPLTGWLMSSARGFQVSFFNLFAFPDLIAANESTYNFLHNVHDTLAGTLFVVVLVHAAAALKHHFFDRDNILRRMLPVKLRESGD